ncbi:hypothetical protein HYW83_00970 [Candidatus Peregrinibacteria bacterium]|nr:hypothetical protein [Candidatus Peregrinibacteria bacterium]
MDNTVGSFTKIQIALILGSLLGDGTLRKQSPGRNPLLEVNHSIHSKEYVDWKYEILKNLVSTPPKARKGNGSRIAYRFTTRSLKKLNYLYERFYRNKRKILPDFIKLTPMLLAVWFMDDGSKSRNSLYFNTQQFDLNDQRKLIHWFALQWNIKATLNKDKYYFRIRINTEGSKKLKEVMRPFIHTSFLYKLR